MQGVTWQSGALPSCGAACVSQRPGRTILSMNCDQSCPPASKQQSMDAVATLFFILLGCALLRRVITVQSHVVSSQGSPAGQLLSLPAV